MKNSKVPAVLFCVFIAAWIKGATSQRPLYFIHAPNVIRTDTKESVSIAVQGVATPVKVQVYIQNYPSRKKTLGQKEVEVKPGSPQIINLTVKADDIPLPANKDDKEYVYLVAKSDSAALKFQKEARVLLSRKSRMVYIQTDKPIYTPTQTVRIRMIPVGIDLKPFSANGLTVEIKNPDGKIVERYDRLFSRIGYMSESFTLGDTPLTGNWTVSALYENQNTSVTFEVREYVLPRFSLEINGPSYVLENDNFINIRIKAKYVYGKPVQGSSTLKIGVINDRSEVIHIARVKDSLSKNGEVLFRIPTSMIKDLKENIWFPDGDRLNIEASVQEKTSGQIETSYDTSIHFSTTPYRISFKRSMAYFKPGLPYEIQLDVKYPSKRPAIRKTIVVSGVSTNSKNEETKLNSYGNRGYEAVTDKLGRTKVTLDVPSDAVSIIVKAKLAAEANIADKYNKDVIHNASPYQSPSKSYTLVRSQETIPKVGDIAEVEAFIVTTKAIQELQYMVVARGKLLLHKTYMDPGAITSLRFKVTSEMSPSMRVVIYYNLEDKGKTEVVSDYTVVHVECAFENKVSVKTTKREERPGADTVVTIKGSPNSNAAVLAVDKSIYLLRDNHKLTQDVVFRELKRFDLGCGFGGGKDGQEVLKNAGIITLTNADFPTYTRTDLGCSSDEVSRKRRSVEGMKCCEDGKTARKNPKSCKAQALEKKLDEACQKIFIRCCKNKEYRGRSILGEEEDDEIVEDDRRVQFRSNFPETWLFGDVDIGPTGIATMNVKVPDTITTWVLQAFATNAETGLGVATPYELVGFKPFFVQLNLPYAMIRNEQVMLSATVYNFGQSQAMARVYLKGAEGLCYDSRENKRSTPQRLRIKGNDAVTIRFPIIPLEIGEKNVTVIAYTSDGGDAVTRPIRIEPEGTEEVKTVSELIDPTAAVGSKQQTLQLSADIPADAIPGSESATFFITGDLLGPIVTKLLKNVQKALRNPVEVYQVSATETFTVNVPQTYTYTYTETYTEYYRTYTRSCYCNVGNGGCMRSRTASRTNQRTGVRQVQRTRSRTVWRKRDRFVVQGMAPNVYVLRYLQKTKQLTEDVRKTAEGYIKESYRRLLGHRTKDGSFNVWGNTEAGTVWLTAFVAQNLQHASEFIEIDNSVICGTADYLVKSQKASGAFLDDGETTTKGMMGGTKGDPAMTAFVLISLLELRCDKSTMKISGAVQKAQEYLEKKLPSMKRSYDLAITSYALAMVNSAKITEVLKTLENMASKDEAAKTVHWPSETESSTVEATSYALLALMLRQKTTYSKGVIKWLTQHRNAEGGFSSGQDTVVGLQAISAYASVDPLLNLKVAVTSTTDASFSKTFRINKRNALVQEEIEVPVGGNIVVKTGGVGTAEAQLELHYNVPQPKARVCPFRTKYDVKELNSKDSFGYELTACVRNVGKDEVGTTVLEIGVLTGFVPVHKSFEKMLNLSSIKRYELTDRAMVVYFPKVLKTADSCIKVSFTRAFDVGLVQPAPIVVKDFLEPSISCTTMYSLSSNNPVLKKVCKGKQCSCMQERCSPCKPKQMRREFCKKDFVGIFKIKNVRKVGTWKVHSAKVQKIFRGDHLIAGRKVDFWVSSTCRCPRFIKNRLYLVMSMRGHRFELNDQSFIRETPRKKRQKIEYTKLAEDLDALAARGC